MFLFQIYTYVYVCILEWLDYAVYYQSNIMYHLYLDNILGTNWLASTYYWQWFLAIYSLSYPTHIINIAYSLLVHLVDYDYLKFSISFNTSLFVSEVFSSVLDIITIRLCSIAAIIYCVYKRDQSNILLSHLRSIL